MGIHQLQFPIIFGAYTRRMKILLVVLAVVLIATTVGAGVVSKILA